MQGLGQHHGRLRCARHDSVTLTALRRICVVAASCCHHTVVPEVTPERRTRLSNKSERGAVAVEFALLAPVLILILLGIMEFGRAYNVQATLSNAARESVRVMAIHNSQSAAKAAAKNAAAVLTPGLKDEKIVLK